MINEEVKLRADIATRVFTAYTPNVKVRDYDLMLREAIKDANKIVDNAIEETYK